MVQIWPESGTMLSDKGQRGSTYDLEWAILHQEKARGGIP